MGASIASDVARFVHRWNPKHNIPKLIAKKGVLEP
jgi:hypothetical protein